MNEWMDEWMNENEWMNDQQKYSFFLYHRLREIQVSMQPWQTRSKMCHWWQSLPKWMLSRWSDLLGKSSRRKSSIQTLWPKTWWILLSKKFLVNQRSFKQRSLAENNDFSISPTLIQAKIFKLLIFFTLAFENFNPISN